MEQKKGRNIIKILYFILIFIGIVCMVIVFSKPLAVTWFHWSFPLIFSLAVLLKAFDNSGETQGEESSLLYGLKKVIVSALALVVIWVVAFLAFLLQPRDRQQIIQSPQGSNTIVLEYDLVSRPKLYRKKDGLFLTPIPLKTSSGYNESVEATINWLSEEEFEVVVEGQVLDRVILN